MPTAQDKLLPVWERIVVCRKCLGLFPKPPIHIDEKAGIFPRGFGLQPQAKSIDLVFILNNPGQPYVKEKEMYLEAYAQGPAELALRVSDFVWRINTDQLPDAVRDNQCRGLNNKFYKLFQDLMGQGLTLYITQTVKCQDRKRMGSNWKKAIGPCADHLLAELDTIKPRVIVSTVKRNKVKGVQTVFNSIATQRFSMWHARTIHCGYPLGKAARSGKGVSTDGLPCEWVDWEDVPSEVNKMVSR